MAKKSTYEELTQKVKAFEESEEKYRVLFENADDLIVVVDTSGNFMDLNRKFEQESGYDRKEMIGKNAFASGIMTPASATRSLSYFKDLLAGRTWPMFQIEGLTKEGKTIPYELRAVPIKKEGTIVAVQAIMRNLTERKETETELRQEKKRLESLVENSSLAIVTVDGKSNIVSCNQAFEALFQFTEGEITGKNLDELVAGEDYGDEAAAYTEQTQKGTPVHATGKRYRKDGTLIHVEFFGVPVVLDGQVVGAYGIYLDIGDRVQAEQALRKSEESVRTILRVAPIGIGLVHDRVFRWVNHEMLRMLGYSMDELIGKNSRILFESHDEYERVGKVKYGKIAQRGTGETESRYRRKNGTLMDVNLRSAPIDPDDLSEGVIFTAMDITQQKQAEAALKRSEERYRTILESIEEGYYEVDLKGNFRFLNDSFCRITGFSKDELIGANYRSFTDGRSAERAYWLFNKVYTSGQSIPGFDWDILTKDRRKRYLSASVSLMRDTEGKPNGFRGIIRDVTERRKALEALRDSEERFKALGENAPDIVYTLDIDGAFVYVNPAWERILGHKREEVIGKFFIHFAKEKDKRAYVRTFKRIRDGKETLRNVPITLLAKDGSIRVFDASGSPNLNSGGEVTGMVGLFKDVTEQRRLEAQFQHAQRMEAVGTLAGGVAHDFNNLLMGIQGRASLMLTTIDDSHPHFEHLKGIEEYVKSSAALTKQLLGFARGGRYEVKVADINRLVRKSTEMFGRTKKEIRIHSKYQEGLWPAEVDTSQVEQVLVNLYVNAWQAMSEGGDLFVETKNVTLDESYMRPYRIQPGRYVRISITDTGVGMDKEIQGKIFDPFFTTKEIGRGTGLGLASAYGIIKGHNGIINVYSEPGQGSTFSIYLPASSKEVTRKPHLGKGVLRGSETVLLVDDEKMIIEVGRRMLEQMGYQVLVAGGGKEAVRVYEEKRDQVDLVVLDMIMPDMGGADTYDALKEINPRIKVLLASGYSINSKAAEILNRGCDGFVQKPFDMTELSRKIRGVLEQTPPQPVT